LYTQSLACFRAGRFDQALQLVDRSLILRPAEVAQIHRVICLAKLDRWEEARDAVRSFRDASPGFPLRNAEKLPANGVYGPMDPAELDDFAATIRRVWDDPPDRAHAP
jgi:hypothetical protein